MKNRKRIWKFIGGAIGLTTIACIIPACVVSCGSSSSTNDSNTTNSSSSIVKQKEQLTKDEAISNADLKPTFVKYEQAWNDYIKNGDNYANLVKKDLTYFCNNALTYFNNFCNAYNNLTNAPSILAGSFPVSDNWTGSFPMNNNWISTIANYNITDNGEQDSIQDDLFIQLSSFSYSNLTINKTNHTFDVTFNYQTQQQDSQDYVTNNSISGSLIYTNAMIEPTLLASFNDLFSANKINVFGGWYISTYSNVTPNSSQQQSFTSSNANNQKLTNAIYVNPSQTALSGVMFPWANANLSGTFNQDGNSAAVTSQIISGTSWSKYLNDYFEIAGFDIAINDGKLTTYQNVENSVYSNRSDYSAILTMSVNATINNSNAIIINKKY